jgi:redox-sensitive bicupin YhaK (pirin superfamily)
MIQLRPFASLGAFRNEWLNAHHHFSFGNYHDPDRMGVGRLRVWNDDEVAPGAGFDPHPHRDMEIVTYIREGAITHRDNLGNEGRTEAGDVQVMHAGTGIFHAELNKEDVPTRLFQIWIMPDKRGVAPGWGTRVFPRGNNGLSVLASGRPSDAFSDALKLNADAAVLAGTLAQGQTTELTLGAGRAAYLVPVNGIITVTGAGTGTSAGADGHDGVTANPRDGVAILGERTVKITATQATELVVVEVAA